MGGIFQDLRYALRSLTKSPGFAAVAVIILALGIGANSAIFSLVDTLYLRRLPVRDPGRLIEIYRVRGVGEYMSLSYLDYLFYRDHCRAFSDLAAHYSSAPIHLASTGSSSEVNGSVVTANYFDLLGLKPALGRFFLPEEDRVPGRDPVAVIGHGLWQGRFGGDPGIVGRIIRMNAVAFTVVGVAPRNFRGVPLGGLATDVWIPSAMFHVGYRYCDAFQPGCNVVKLLGRLRPGVTLVEARSEMNLQARRLEIADPGSHRGYGVFVAPARGVDPEYREETARPVPLLVALAGLVLVIACANLAGLLLARGTARRSEIAIRTALGASRGRIVRQLLTESLLLSLAGATLGIFVAFWAADLVGSFYGADTEGRRAYFSLGLDPLVLAWTLGVSLVTAIASGLVPALQTSRTDLARAVKGGSPGTRRHRFRLLDGLVVAQLALSLILVVGAGLILASLRSVYRGPGFDPSPIVLVRLRPSLVGYGPARAQEFQREAVHRLTELPGVRAVSPAEMPPLPDWGHQAAVWLPGRKPDRLEGALRAVTNRVGPRYFETIGVRLVEGREFDDRDTNGAPRVAVVNETLARTLWPGQAAVDRSVFVGGTPHRVVGVVRDAQYRSAGQPPTPYLYTSFWQSETIDAEPLDSRLHIRVAGDPRAMLRTIRLEIAALDPDVPISEDRPLTEWLDYAFQPVRLAGTVLTCFGALGLLLSAIGLYGVLAFRVARQRREIAIRMALGADAGRVGRSIVGRGAVLAVFGAGLGTAGALASARLAAGLLYGVPPNDPATLLAVIGLLSGVALLACYLPARRAARIDPAVALRSD